ncbi:hypothetical protein VSS37_00195 [Candidatus Thiothrix sp. Deng01]|uniref:Uncharacterized protein n=1 Tax=Candidatus Thiothrix phosphatis TaxID=3112415 RepID=A0ABU6CSM5_9GAMM|nr:hypothetical protein [Candidatus Thiothrix sp. Deng01]MEB4589388.1 hypothetical protein [Candidatus Thiothrix sp. Deng01]
MVAKILRRMVTGISVVMLVVMAIPTEAAPISAVSLSGAQTPLSKVLFMATLNNGPAMRPVKWQLYRIDKNGQSKLVEAFKRHSASLELEPGIYRAEAMLDNVNRSRTFDVRTVGDSNVIIAMD